MSLIDKLEDYCSQNIPGEEGDISVDSDDVAHMIYEGRAALAWILAIPHGEDIYKNSNTDYYFLAKRKAIVSIFRLTVTGAKLRSADGMDIADWILEHHNDALLKILNEEGKHHDF